MARPQILALLLAAAPAAAEEPATPEGRMEGDGVHVEILGKPVVVGERVDLPEGWFRVEEAGIEDGEVGSFSVVSTSEPPAAASTAAAIPSPPATPEPGPPAPACRAERAAYLRELWKTSGIDVEDVDAVLDGLDAGQGAASGYAWFALQTDPFRPLAWSSDLRDRARDLARCVRGHALARR